MSVSISLYTQITQSKTHKLSADKVYIGTTKKNNRPDTIEDIKEAGIGLIHVLPDKRISIIIENNNKNPVKAARMNLLKKIKEI